MHLENPRNPNIPSGSVRFWGPKQGHPLGRVRQGALRGCQAGGSGIEIADWKA